MNVSSPKLSWPFDTDGVQAVTVHTPGWTWQPMPDVFVTAREAQRHVDASIDYWTRYTDNIEFTYYGYDPRIVDDGTVDGVDVVLGTDGDPDAIGRYDADTETVVWEES